MLCMTLTGIGEDIMFKTAGMVYICNDYATDWHQVCRNRGSILIQKTCRKRRVFLNLDLQSAMRSCENERCVGHLHTLIVQLIGANYMQICEAVWAEPSRQNTTCV